jgi:hypothetical protein
MSRPGTLFSAIGATAFGLFLAIGVAAGAIAQPTPSPAAAASDRLAMAPIGLGCDAAARQASIERGGFLPLAPFDIGLAPD